MVGETKNINKPLRTTLFIGLCVLIVALYMFRSTVYAELNTLKLIPIPEHFTELYFENYTSFPKETVARENAVFSFTIHNVEGATTTYPYSVYFKYPDGYRYIFTNGTTTLSNDGYQTITVSHTFRSSNLEGEVVVELLGMNQHIDFILPNTN